MVQLVGNIWILDIAKRCRITVQTVMASKLGRKTLYHVSDCHSRGEAVRVNDKVWHHALDIEWQIFLTIVHTNSTLLPVARGKFVTDLRNTSLSDTYLKDG